MSTDWQKLSPDVIERAAKIKVLLMDVDGCMTDGKLFYLPGPDGAMVETKGFNSHDGLGLHLCYAVGIVTGVISGRQSPAMVERARMLNMKYVYQGLLDKIETYEAIVKDAGVSNQHVAFIGDDFPDVPVMRKAGFAVAVANARPEVQQAAQYVTQATGGNGAIRETVEIILKAQGIWEQILDKYRLDVQAVS